MLIISYILLVLGILGIAGSVINFIYVTLSLFALPFVIVSAVISAIVAY